MVENPTPAATAPPSDSSTTVVKQRYAPPNQRNRSLNRRKSGGFDRSNNVYGSDGEKNQVNASSSNVLNENPRQKLIGLEGCSRSEAAQLLNNRWAAAMHRYNDASIDPSERPVMYSASGGAAAWTQFRLPHQIMPPPNSVGPSSGSSMDFLAELRRAMRNSPASSDN